MKCSLHAGFDALDCPECCQEGYAPHLYTAKPRRSLADDPAAVPLSDFKALLEEAEDMRTYVDDYFAEKWGHDEALEKARAVVSAAEGDTDA